MEYRHQGFIEIDGSYGEGGGKIQFAIHPVHELKPICLIERGSLRKIRGISAVSNLPIHVAERQKERALKRIREELKVDSEITLQPHVPSSGPGSFLFLLAECEKIFAGFSSLGAKGKPAEKVADEAIDSLKEYMESDGGIDPHLADQIVPFMALAKGNSCFTTIKMTEHLLTNLWVIGHFLEVKVRKQGDVGRPIKVEFLNE
mgnify:CR=1 FL=1